MMKITSFKMHMIFKSSTHKKSVLCIIKIKYQSHLYFDKVINISFTFVIDITLERRKLKHKLLVWPGY